MLPDPILRRVRLSARRSTSPGVRSLLMILPLAAVMLAACGSAAPGPTPSPSASSPPAPAVTPAAEPSPQGCYKKGSVGYTNGLGVNVRATPGGDVVTAYTEGTRLTICAEKDADGQHWYQVQGEDGGEGWVAAEYVVEGDSGG